MYFVYVLHSFAFNRNYVGISTDLERRLKEHNSGRNISTRSYIPWEVVFIEQYDSRLEAREREKYLKSAAGRVWRKKNIELRPRGATE